MPYYVIPISVPSLDNLAAEFSFEPCRVAEDSHSIGSERDLSIVAADSSSTGTSNHDSASLSKSSN